MSVISELCIDSKEICNCPSDPYSESYRNYQIDLYRKISGRSLYTVENESSIFDFESVKNNPYPYFTGDPQIVGDQLMAIGYLIRTAGVPKGAKIIEFGPGWGNTTLNLVQMGYKVTAVEIEKKFIDLIRYKVNAVLGSIELINEDMLKFSSETTDKYDCAIFFESFHHCHDHIRLLKNLYNIIKENGIICFAAEPLAESNVEHPYPHFPYPWGVRLDGLSIWSMRRFGWLELGFDTSYFLRTLLLYGWIPRQYHSDISPLTNITLARKCDYKYEPSEITMPPDECRTWGIKETSPTSKLRYSHVKSILSCFRQAKVKSLEFCISNPAPFDLEVTICGKDSGKTLIIPKKSFMQTYLIPITGWEGKVTISSRIWNPHKVLKSNDNRDIGVACHYFRLIIDRIADPS